MQLNQKEETMKKSIYSIVCLTLMVVLGVVVVVHPGPAQAKTLNFALAGNPDTLDPHKTPTLTDS